MKNEAEIRRRLREWIASQSGKTLTGEFTDDTPIIELRILKSVQIPELILYIEEATGRALDVEMLKPGVFKNIDTIYRNFFEATDDRDSSEA